MNLCEAALLPKNVLTFAYLLAVSGIVVSGMALVIERGARRRSTPFRYGVLLAGISGLLAAPALVGIGQALAGLFAISTEETIRIPAEQLTDVPGQPAPQEAASPGETASIPGAIVGAPSVGIWAVGVVLGLIGGVRGLWRHRRAFADQPWHPEWWSDDRRRMLAENVGLRRFPAVRRSLFAPMPMVVGLWRPRIVMPEAAPETWGQAQWEAVLLHEAAHIARRDQWAALAQRLAVVLFWWCPLVYFLSRRLNQLRETICDDYALESCCDRLAFAELLVETAERLVNLKTMPAPVGLLDPAHGGLEERITRLLTKEKRPMTKLTLAGKLVGAAAFTLACLTITAATAYSQAPPAQKKIQIKIIVDGKEIDLTDETLQALAAAKKQPPPKAGQPLPEAQKKRDEANRQLSAKWRKALLADANRLVVTTDPRIEELVKQAEQIKPGSGAAVRQALQGAGGRAILRLDDLKKVVDSEVKDRADYVELRKLVSEVRPPTTAELDALRQQIQRLSSELEALKKRLEAQKK
jgi:beta-lactamase regulating signal transducer with metallopeptidase domain